MGGEGGAREGKVGGAGGITAGRVVRAAADAREVVNRAGKVSGHVRAGAAGRKADGCSSRRGTHSVAVERSAVLAAPAGAIVRVCVCGFESRFDI